MMKKGEDDDVKLSRVFVSSKRRTFEEGNCRHLVDLLGRKSNKEISMMLQDNAIKRCGRIFLHSEISGPPQEIDMFSIADLSLTL